ncbi:cell cycle exit and neuronal differentiation protein 1-like [Amblyraja radiata]|uniref:cell cycle exit and neuronal differentiation protein 1-like n=1 Tax=Amblyraja radiata TaxID=386614 RepID=UPI0014037566|nr:cell cycle exit and neuronal differentiation protein 1-like [Amblyraja radiata]XP_032895054.1 cell cycle exit and neuronal differentiation protein 1-like [Amblyraja radiata]
METRNRSKVEAKESPKSATSKINAGAADKKEFAGKQPEPTNVPKKAATEATAASETKPAADSSVTLPAVGTEGKKPADPELETQATKEETSEGQPSNLFENMKPYILGGVAITGLAILVGVIFILHKK